MKALALWMRNGTTTETPDIVIPSHSEESLPSCIGDAVERHSHRAANATTLSCTHPCENASRRLSGGMEFLVTSARAPASQVIAKERTRTWGTMHPVSGGASDIKGWATRPPGTIPVFHKRIS